MLPQPQPLSESEFDILIGGAVKDSIQTLARLTGFASEHACVPTQYLRIVTMMYDQLNANRIPDGTIGKDFSVESLDVAIASLVGLGVTFPLWLSHKDLWKVLLKGLSIHWPNIRRWLLFLHRNVIVKEDIAMDTRYTCKSAILQFLGLVRDKILIPWSKSIPTDREVMKMVCDLWFIETRDPRFCSRKPGTNAQRESGVFNSCLLVAHEVGIPIDWANLLSLFHGEPELIATVSLCHLDHEISHGGELDLNCIAWDLHIVTVLSLRESICLALMRQGAIKAASEILGLVVDRQWEGEKRVSASRCMVNAIVFLWSRIEDSDALPFLLQALERGLVPSLLKCEALLSYAEQPAVKQQVLLLLGELLPAYSIYRSILHQLALGVDSAIKQNLDTELYFTVNKEIYRAWQRLRDVVQERRRLVRRGVTDSHVQTCYNNKCAKASALGRFKRCAGCLHAYYCGRKCQRYDWTHGKHKHYCVRIFQRFIRTRGQMSTVHSKDLKFFDQVILAELRKHSEQLSSLRSKTILVELNFVGGGVNIVFVARGSDSNPFKTKCSCEIFANDRWKHIAEVARETKRPMVLVRAFIAGGLSRKIVLQAIPLSVIVHGGQIEGREGYQAEKYRFNMIYTCCGVQVNNQAGPK